MTTAEPPVGKTFEVLFCGKRALVSRTDPVINLTALFGPNSLLQVVRCDGHTKTLVVAEPPANQPAGNGGAGGPVCYRMTEGASYVVVRAATVQPDASAAAATAALPLSQGAAPQPPAAAVSRRKRSDQPPVAEAADTSTAKRARTEAKQPLSAAAAPSPPPPPPPAAAAAATAPAAAAAASAPSIGAKVTSVQPVRKVSPSPAPPPPAAGRDVFRPYLHNTQDVFRPSASEASTHTDKAEKRGKKDKKDKKASKSDPPGDGGHDKAASASLLPTKRSASPSRGDPSMAPPSPVQLPPRQQAVPQQQQRPAVVAVLAQKKMPILPPASPALGFQNPAAMFRRPAVDSDSD